MPVAFVTLAPGSRTTADDLRGWAQHHVSEQAAAPKSVTVLEALPVTDVGKPFKPALRAEALRDAVADALHGIPFVAGVRGVVEGEGEAVAVVDVAHGVDTTPLEQALDRFAISWRLEFS